MPKQDRWPGNAEQEHIACIASIHPPARGPSAKQTPFPPPRPLRRMPPGQPGKQCTQVEASSACAHRAAAPKTSAQICAALTKRSCASCGRAMARVTLTSLGPCVPMRRRYKLKLPLRHMGLQGSPDFKPFHTKWAGRQLQPRPLCCSYLPNRGSIYAQHAREATVSKTRSTTLRHRCAARTESARNPRLGRPLGSSPESFSNFWAVHPTNAK